MFRQFEDERDALHDRVRSHAEAEVREVLAKLKARFPRHAFSLSQGMGSTSINIEPAVLGEDSLGTWNLDGNRNGWERGALPEMLELCRQIAQITDDIDEFFRCQNFEIGNVTLEE